MICTQLYRFFCILAYRNKLATVVEGDPKAPFSIGTTSRCSEGRCSFPRIDPHYSWSVPNNLCKEESSTIFWVFGMTRPGIEPKSSGTAIIFNRNLSPLAIKEKSIIYIYIYIYIYIWLIYIHIYMYNRFSFIASGKRLRLKIIAILDTIYIYIYMYVCVCVCVSDCSHI